MSNGKKSTENVISPNRAQRHNIYKYDFREMGTKEVKDTGTKDSVFRKKYKEIRKQIIDSTDPVVNSEGLEEENSTAQQQKPLQPITPQPITPQSAPPQPQNAVQESSVEIELVEKLLGKADELGNAIAQMQSQMDGQQQEFNARLEEEKQRAFQAGYDKGITDVKNDMDAGLQEIKQTMLDSIQGLEDSKSKFNQSLESIEKELSSIAVDIAREVIIAAVSENSSKISLELTSSLLENIRDASQVTLKLNPADFEFVSAHFQDETNIKCEPDKAIAKGGVVIISDSGNVDGTVMSRYQTLKTTILENQQNQN